MDEKWRICLLDTKEQNPNHYIVLAIEAALKDHDQVELVRARPTRTRCRSPFETDAICS